MSEILAHARETAAAVRSHNEVKPQHVQVEDGYVGEGYAYPTDSMVEAVQLFAQLEAILLDPVYTGKAAAGLIDMVRKGRFGRGDDVLFLHTGGAPGLHAYEELFRGLEGPLRADTGGR